MLSDTLAHRILTSAESSTDIRRGGNSRVTRVVDDGVEYAVKDYRQRSNGVARLQREQMALEFLYGHLPDVVPSPLWHSEYSMVAIHSWVPGTRPTLDESTVEGLLARFGDLDRLKDIAEQCGIPPAVDSIRHEHELSGQIRDRCRALSGDHRLRLESRTDQILSVLQDLSGDRVGFEQSGKALFTLSPSDAGPHNLLQDPTGLPYRIVDWEFFGVDDAHKLVGDSILHPQTIWSETLLDRFLQGTLSQFPLDLGRLERLLPLLSLKWATIVLARAANFSDHSEGGVMGRGSSTSPADELTARYLRLARESDLEQLLQLACSS